MAPVAVARVRKKKKAGSQTKIPKRLSIPVQQHLWSKELSFSVSRTYHISHENLQYPMMITSS